MDETKKYLGDLAVVMYDVKEHREVLVHLKVKGKDLEVVGRA